MDRPYLILIASFSVAFMAYGIRYTYGILLPEMMAGLGMGNTVAGLVYFSFFLSYTIVSLLVGLLVDSWGARRTVLTFLPIFAVGVGLIGMAGSALEAAVYLAIVGVGASVGWIPLVIWVQMAFPARRGFYLGILQTGCNMGFGTMGLIVQPLASIMGWREVWMVLGLMAAVWLIPLAILAGDMIPGGDGGPPIDIRRLTSLVLKGRAWAGGISYMFAAFAIMVPVTFVKAFASLELGMSAEVAASMYALMGFMGVAGAVIVSAGSDILGRKRTLILANTILAIGLIGLYAVKGGIDMSAWISVLGFSYGSIWPLYAALARDEYGWGTAGSVMGLWTVFAGLGLLAAPPIGGLLADFSGSYRPAYLLGAVIAMASLVPLVMGGRGSVHVRFHEDAMERSIAEYKGVWSRGHAHHPGYPGSYVGSRFMQGYWSRARRELLSTLRSRRSVSRGL